MSSDTYCLSRFLPSDKRLMDSIQLTQPPPQKWRKTVAIRIRSASPSQPPVPVEESPAKEPSVDVPVDREKSTPPIFVAPISSEVTQSIQIDSSSSHSSAGSSPLSSVKYTSSQKTSHAHFTSSLGREMSDIGRQARREARLDRK